MIDYTMIAEAAKSQPGSQSGGAPLWSRAVLQPLAPGALTPFSASVLAEMAGRAWFNYYDRLGFDPMPKARVVRSVQGRPFFTLTLSAQLEAEHAGSEPPVLSVNGVVRPLARFEKPGLLAALKLRGGASKLAAVLPALAGELDAAAEQGQTWLRRVQAMHWSQAEILQIMEEIERVGARTLQLYVAARLHLEFAFLRLSALPSAPTTPQQMEALAAALRLQGASVDDAIARRVADLAGLAAAEPAARAFLTAGNFADWANRLPAGPLADGLAALLADHGHRCIGEGELMTPRWAEDPSALLAAIAAAQQQAVAPAPAAPDEAPFLALVDGKRRKEAQTLLAQARQALLLQSHALDVHAYTLAGTRIWALAAGHEALGDGRLLAVDDVFFYELEETKQMMTGEWNISDLDGIHATASERKVLYHSRQQSLVGDLLVGEGEAAAPPWPASAGDPTRRAGLQLGAAK